MRRRRDVVDVVALADGLRIALSMLGIAERLGADRIAAKYRGEVAALEAQLPAVVVERLRADRDEVDRTYGRSPGEA